MTRTMLLHIVFLGLLGLGACSKGSSSCETAACKSAETWADVADGQEHEQGLKMLQVRGSKLMPKGSAEESNAALAKQVQGLPACEMPTTPKKLLHPKSCPYQSAHAGVWGVSCLNGNTAYENLKDAWANCGKEEECGSILEAADGKYYLRRSSDPDMTDGDGANLTAFGFQCDVRDMYFDQLRREEEDAARQTQAQLDEEYKVKCPMPKEPKVSPSGKNCPEGGMCLNANKPYNIQENAWVACAQIEGCGAVMQMPDGRFFLRRLSDPDMPKANNVNIVEFTCEAVEKERTKQEEEKFESEKAEAEMLIRAAETRCPMPAQQDIEPTGKGCPEDAEKGLSCLNDNTEYPNLAEAWVACAETHECGLILQHSNSKFYLRRTSDPDMPQESKSYSIKFTCASLEGQTLKEVAQADRIQELQQELAEARKLQRYEQCLDFGVDKESRDAKCEGNLRCARKGFDNRQFGDCEDKHCCSKEFLPRGVECFFFGEDVESRDAACEGNLKCARRGFENRSFGDCKHHHCCSDEENPLTEEIDFEIAEPSSVMRETAEAAKKKAEVETIKKEAELQEAKAKAEAETAKEEAAFQKSQAEAVKEKAKAEKAKVEAELQKAKAEVKAELKRAEAELEKVRLLKAEEVRTESETAEVDVETVEAEMPKAEVETVEAEMPTAKVEKVEVEMTKREERAKKNEAEFEESLKRMEQEENKEKEQEEEFIEPREAHQQEAAQPDPPPYGEAADQMEPSPYVADAESVEEVRKFEEAQHAADGEEYPEEEEDEQVEEIPDAHEDAQAEGAEDIEEIPDADEAMEVEQENGPGYLDEDMEEQETDGELMTAQEEEEDEEAEEEEEEEVEEEAVKAVKEAVKKAMEERRHHRPNKVKHAAEKKHATEKKHAAENGIHTGQFHLKDEINHQEVAEHKAAEKTADATAARVAAEKVRLKEKAAKRKAAQEEAEKELFREAAAEREAAEKAAAENAAKEKAAMEEAAAAEKAAMEKTAKVNTGKETVTKEQKESAEKKVAAENAAAEKAAKEQAAEEKADKKVAADKAASEKAAKEQAAKEKAEKAQKATAKKAAAEKTLAKKEAADKAATEKAERKAEEQTQKDDNQVISGYEAQYNAQVRAMFDSTADTECGWGADRWCREDNQAFINEGSHSQKDVPEEDVIETCGHICARAAEGCGGFNWDVKTKTCFFRKFVKCGIKHHIGTTCYKKRMLSGL